MLSKLKVPFYTFAVLFIIVQTILLVYVLKKLEHFEQMVEASKPIVAQQQPQNEEIPEEPRIFVETKGSPFIGNENAPVTIVEFSDFECTFCKMVQPTLKEIQSTYKDSVKLVFRHYPLSDIHTNAALAANASLCANDQNQFWKYHDSIFAKANGSGSLSQDVLIESAKEVGLDINQFTACVESKKHLAVVKKDYDDGNLYKVNGTPTFFINGRVLRGNLPSEEFTKVIDEALSNK